MDGNRVKNVQFRNRATGRNYNDFRIGDDRMKRVKCHFTLIEMLAVVAIASILIALITPAVQGLMFGSRVDQYASNFKLGLEQAQSKAIASRRYVALVLPYNHSNNENNTKHLNQYCKGGYRMAYVTRNGENYNFDRWVDNHDWKNPNAGALCVDITTTGPSDKDSDGDIDADDKEKWASDMKSRVESLALADKFSSLSNIGNINNAGIAGVVDGSSEGSCMAVIFSPYGGIVNSVKPLYFSFTEAKIDGSRYVLDNEDNFLVLKLNAITGQVTYFDPYED